MSQEAEGAYPVAWITGLSGSGKTTLAARVVRALRQHDLPVIHIDGDRVRAVFGNDLGYDDADRLRNAWRIAKLCTFLQQEGALVVCSTMSMYPEIWEWNRAQLCPYLEVFLEVPLDLLRQRDQKGLYSGIRTGTASSVVGEDLLFQRPPSPDLILGNRYPTDLPVNERRIVAGIRALARIHHRTQRRVACLP